MRSRGVYSGVLLLSLIFAIILWATPLSRIVVANAQGVPLDPALKSAHIVNDRLIQSADGFKYRVIGKIYNSNDRALVNVVVVYRIWKKWQGTDGRGSYIKETGGRVSARIKYLPPKQIVDFETGADASVQIDGVPDPIDAEIQADFAI